MNKQDRQAVFLGAILENVIVRLRSEHAARGTHEQVGAAAGQPLHEIAIAAIGTDHDADPPERRLEDGRLGARRVADQLVLELVLAILADELAIRADQHGCVVAVVAIRFEQSGDQMDLESVGQRREPAKYSPSGIGSPRARYSTSGMVLSLMA